jgi:8-oxo-dGTP pyrophosphatase MutT (NUDIX family)
MGTIRAGDDAPPIRRAATAICVRAGWAGFPELLVVRRSPQSRFLPGYLAFPGGAVDHDDAAHAARWFANPEQAHRAAAIRELSEEVGLVVTAGGVAAGSLASVDADPPAASALHELCRWVAPPDVPVRFDARYFAVAAPDAVEPLPDGHETTAAMWIAAPALLDAWASGEHKLYWPTWYTVSRLARCANVPEVLAASFETREPTQAEIDTMPTHVMENEP